MCWCYLNVSSVVLNAYQGLFSSSACVVRVRGWKRGGGGGREGGRYICPLIDFFP